MDRPDDVGEGLKWCIHCGEIKDAEAFARSQQNRDGLNSWCRECNAESVRRSRSGATAAQRARIESERREAEALAAVEQEREHHRWLLGIKASEDAAHARARQRRS